MVAGDLPGLRRRTRAQVDPVRTGAVGAGTRADPGRALAPGGASSPHESTWTDGVAGRAPSDATRSGGGDDPFRTRSLAWEQAGPVAGRGLPAASSFDDTGRGEWSDDGAGRRGAMPRPAGRAHWSLGETDVPPEPRLGDAEVSAGPALGTDGPAGPALGTDGPVRPALESDVSAGLLADTAAAPRSWPGRARVPRESSPGTPGRGRSAWDTVSAGVDEPGTAGRTLRLHPAAAVNPSVPAAPLAGATTRRVRPGPPADLPERGAARTATPRADDLRVHLLSPGRQQTHPNLTAPAGLTGSGTGQRPNLHQRFWTGTAAGPWPPLPAEAGEQTGGMAHDGPARVARRDPWPALPDDRGLWAPVVTAGDADRLARLDREQAGD
ncbi:hypothetical protein Nm8I071_27080 [Nonomuraea sp. TT08I-71]|nr:hypothetical protein Nm8I071_27080 [Nonomuraea sp. TT08I-71]